MEGGGQSWGSSSFDGVGVIGGLGNGMEVLGQILYQSAHLLRVCPLGLDFMGESCGRVFDFLDEAGNAGDFQCEDLGLLFVGPSDKQTMKSKYFAMYIA